MWTPDQERLCRTPLKNFKDHIQDLLDQQILNEPEVIALVKMRAEFDFEFFTQFFFPHHCHFPFSAMHQAICQAESNPYLRGRREVLAAPRGHAKTTFIALFKVLHAIVYKYDPYILIISHSSKEAEQKVQDILTELSDNELLKTVYGDLSPKPGVYKGVARWGSKRFVTQNGVRVEAKSRKKQVRGLKEGANRPSLVICDDVESLEEVRNPEQREKTLDWFRKDVLKIGQSDNTTNFILVGTVLHPDSLLSNLLKTAGYTHHVYRAVIQFAKNQELWNQYRVLYTDLSSANRVAEAHAFYLQNQSAMDDGVEVLWPPCDPYEKLICMQIDEGIGSFESEKQNNPYDPERQKLNMAAAKTFHYLYDPQGQRIGLKWNDSPHREILFSDLREVVAYHDPSLEATNKSDFAAIVVVALDLDGRMYCLHDYLARALPTRQLEQAFILQKDWGFERLYLEITHGQRLLRQQYDTMKAEHPGVHLEILPVQPHENKKARIATLELLITNGHLLFSDTLSHELIDQLTQFPTHQHDDGPDALHGAVEQLKKRLLNLVPLGMPISVQNDQSPSRTASPIQRLTTCLPAASNQKSNLK